LDRARRRELKHAGVLAARQARVDLAASIARLESDEAAGAGGKALASRLAFAVGALFGAEVGEPEGVRDRLREASGVLSGVLAHLSAPGTPRALDDAGAAIAKCLAVLYPARAGLERELDSVTSAETPVVELPAREARSSLTRIELGDESDSVDVARESEPEGDGEREGARPKRNTARGVAPSASAIGLANDPAAKSSDRPARDPAPPPTDLVASRRIPPTREHPLPALTPEQAERLRTSQRTLIRGTDDAHDPDAPTRISRPPEALLREARPQDAQTAVGRPDFTRPNVTRASDPPPSAPVSEPPRRSSAPPGPPRARRRALELVPDADEGLVDRASGSPLVNASNRRTSDRVSLTADIGMHSATQFFTGLGGDVSHGGLFVATWSPLPLGTDVTVSFVLPGGHQVTAPGIVAWLKEPRDSESEETPGMGIQFTSLTGEDRRAIDRFLEKRPAIFHDL
jgi:uncharacterized protein (TIGR02266 family)